MEKDSINHPDHYKTNNGLETIDVIEAFTDGLSGSEATHTGNVFKYMCRWKKKNGLTDLKKAQWYLNRLIEQVEANEKTTRPDYSYYDLIFVDRLDAEVVLKQMRELLRNFKVVSVEELFELAGENYKHADDNKYVWTNLDDAHVKSVRGGYVIQLPMATVLPKQNYNDGGDQK